MELRNTLFELKALRQKLALATYAAVFSPEPTQRAQAVTEAQALQHTLEGVLAKAWDTAEHITRFVRSPARANRLATVDEFVQLLEDIEQAGGNPLAMMSTPTQPGAGPVAWAPAATR